MYSKRFSAIVTQKDIPVFEAYWQFVNSNSELLMVLKDDKLYGVATKNDFNKFKFHDRNDLRLLKIGDICTRKPKVCYAEQNIYPNACYLFSLYPTIHTLPIINKDNKLLDVITRRQAFYLDYFRNNDLPYMDYARCMYSAAELAKDMGYSKISVIEFGVASGRGLLNCEFHAKELERLFDIHIDIYGFDTGEGLPADDDPRNAPYWWFHGKYPMNKARLQERLTRSELVLGDICETSKTFFKDYNPAPIGTILIDVDYYTSTVAILEMLKEDNRFFLPRVSAYFDDLCAELALHGETLAIAEFNESNNDIKISPECYIDKIKTIHRFTHQKYKQVVSAHSQIRPQAIPAG